MSRSYFPSVISGAFKHGLQIVCDFAVIICIAAAGCSALRGGKYHYVPTEENPIEEVDP